MSKNHTDAAPLEVELASETIACRTCEFFWDPPQYGPWAGFNWTEDFPREVLDDPTSNTGPIYWLKAESNGMHTHRPELMSGCRKAPIMTIGINPNLTAFYASPQSAAWGYPQFYDESGTAQTQRFAYYYRHKSINQVSLDLDFIRGSVAEEGAVKAEKAGWLVGAERDMICSQLVLTVRYQDDPENTVIKIPETGSSPSGQTCVVLYDSLSSRDLPKSPQFAAGAVIAGRLEVPAGSPVGLYHEITGYYDRVVPMLEAFQTQAGERLADVKLKMAEDVCMIDMIACASPNWSASSFRRCGESDDYDAEEKTQAQIEGNCIGKNTDHHWVVKQFVQTRPTVLIIVSNSSLKMFHDYLGDCFSANFNKAFYDGEGNSGRLKDGATDDEILQFTHENECWVTVNETVDGKTLEFKSRLIVSPHFSYGDSFYPQAQFSAEDWATFEASYPKARQILNDGVQVGLTPFGNFPPPIYFQRANSLYGGGTAVWLLGKDDKIQKMIEPGAWKDIQARYIDVNQLVTDILLQELEAGRLAGDRQTGHLRRNAGGCQFCVNDQWQFPEGCAYAKPDEPNDAASFLEAVVEKLVGRAEA